MSGTAKGLSLQLVARIVSAASGAVVVAVLTRALSKSEFGTLSLGLTLVTVGLGLADFGATQVAVQRMSAERTASKKVLPALVLVRSGIATLFGCLVAIGFLVAGVSSADQATIVAFLLALPLTGVQAYVALAQARGWHSSLSVGILVQNLGWLGVVVALALVGASAPWYGLGYAATSALAGATALRSSRRRQEVHEWAGVGRTATDLLRISWPLGLGGLFVTAYYRLDAVLLYAFTRASVVAEFAVAYRFLDVLQVIPMTLQTVLLPRLSRAFAEKDGVADVWNRFWGVYLAAACGVVAVGEVVAPGVVQILAGDDYGASVELLRILLPAFAGITLAYAITGALVASERHRLYLRPTMTWAALNIFANVLLMPQYGAHAAAWTTVATEFGMTLTLASRLRGVDGIHFDLGQIASFVLLTSASAGAGLALSSVVGTWVGAAVTAVVFGVACLAFRLIDVAAVLIREPSTLEKDEQ